MRNTVMMSLARRRREESAEQFHTIEAPRFKVTIKGGVVTDVWHRDERMASRRQGVSPDPGLVPVASTVVYGRTQMRV